MSLKDVSDNAINLGLSAVQHISGLAALTLVNSGDFKKFSSELSKLLENYDVLGQEVVQKSIDIGVHSASNMDLIATGLYDSKGNMIYAGGRVRGDTCNPDVHGNWVEYRVELRGLTPILRYLFSEKGQVLPAGYTAGILADEYDFKGFVFTEDLSSLTPADRALVYLGR